MLPQGVARSGSGRDLQVEPAVACPAGVANCANSVTTRRLVYLVGAFFVLQLFFNDVTNHGSIRVGVNIRPDRLALGLLVLTFLFTHKTPSWARRGRVAEVLLIAFGCISLVSCYTAGTMSEANNRYVSTIFNFIWIPTALFMVTRRLSLDRSTLQLLLWPILVLGLYLGITGVLEHYDVRSLVYPGYIMEPQLGVHFGRSRGPFLQAAVFGSVLVVILAGGLWYATEFKKPWTWIAMLCMLSSVYFSYTRSCWVQLGASLAVLCLRGSGTRRYAFVLTGVLLVVAFSGVTSKLSFWEDSLFSRRDGPIDDRRNIMHASVRMFLDRPLFGFGYGTFERENDSYFEQLPGVELRGDGEGNHNTFLGLLAELGLVGTVPYVLALTSMGWACYRLFRMGDGAEPYAREFGLVALAALVGFLVAAQLIDVRFFAFYNALVFCLTGAAHSLLSAAESAAVPSADPRIVRSWPRRSPSCLASPSTP